MRVETFLKQGTHCLYCGKRIGDSAVLGFQDNASGNIYLAVACLESISVVQVSHPPASKIPRRLQNMADQ